MVDLHCGDCLELMKNIPDGSVDLVLTDPPYGTTTCKWDTVIPFEPMWEQLKRIIKPNGAICLFSQQPFTSALVSSNYKMFRYEWIYQKAQGTGFLNSKKMPLKAHENILIFYKQVPTYNPQFWMSKPYVRNNGVNGGRVYGKHDECMQTKSLDGKRFPIDVIKYTMDKDRYNPRKIKADKTHPTQKPVALLEYLVKTYTNEGETVLDFTMGSGSTGVACVNTNRHFIGIELDKGYFDIAQERIEQAQKAVNDGD